jgi:predicted metallo-beta-lactamase superfamily hydrolase
MEPLVTLLLNQGPTGILAVAVLMLWRANQAQAKEHQTEIRRLYEEQRTLVERHIIRSEKWADKGQAIAEKLSARRRRHTGVVTEGEDP